MSRKQMNIRTTQLTREQIQELADAWGLHRGSNGVPNATAVVRQAIDRIWLQECGNNKHDDQQALTSGE